jgi:hypothetical protein
MVGLSAGENDQDAHARDRDRHHGNVPSWCEEVGAVAQFTQGDEAENARDQHGNGHHDESFQLSPLSLANSAAVRC